MTITTRRLRPVAGRVREAMLRAGLGWPEPPASDPEEAWFGWLNELAAHGYIAEGCLGQYRDPVPDATVERLFLPLLESGVLDEAAFLEEAGHFMGCMAMSAWYDQIQEEARANE